MASLVYLTTQAPSPFAETLAHAGYAVYEALSVSEVLHFDSTNSTHEFEAVAQALVSSGATSIDK